MKKRKQKLTNEQYERKKYLARLRYAKNPEQHRQYNKKYRETHKENELLRNRRNDLKGLYGLTIDKYNEMLNHQHGVCYICGQPESATYAGKPRRLSVDHSHTTGKVRALLCNHCNRMLSGAKDNIDILRTAIIYLKELE